MKKIYILISILVLLSGVAAYIFLVPNANLKVELEPLSNDTKVAIQQRYTNEFLDLAKSSDVDLAMIDKLLKKGVDINAQDEKGRTALIYAAKSKNSDVLRHLLLKKADRKIKDNMGVRAIDYLDKQRDSKLYKTLQSNNILIRDKKEGVSKTTASHNKEKNRKLFSTQSSGEDKDTWSPLMIAIKDFENDIVKEYIKTGQFLKDETNNGATPLYFAINYKNNRALDMLLAHGVDIEHINKYAVKPLAYAIIKDNFYAVKQIVEHGADVDSKVNGVRTPIELSKENRRKKIEKYLRSIGAS